MEKVLASLTVLPAELLLLLLCITSRAAIRVLPPLPTFHQRSHPIPAVTEWKPSTGLSSSSLNVFAFILKQVR